MQRVDVLNTVYDMLFGSQTLQAQLQAIKEDEPDVISRAAAHAMLGNQYANVLRIHPRDMIPADRTRPRSWPAQPPECLQWMHGVFAQVGPATSPFVNEWTQKVVFSDLDVDAILADSRHPLHRRRRGFFAPSVSRTDTLDPALIPLASYAARTMGVTLGEHCVLVDLDKIETYINSRERIFVGWDVPARSHTDRAVRALQEDTDAATHDTAIRYRQKTRKFTATREHFVELVYALSLDARERPEMELGPVPKFT
jgi:hypothetical protein